MNNLELEELNLQEMKDTNGGMLPLMAAAAIYIIGVETGWW